MIATFMAVLMFCWNPSFERTRLPRALS
jgi:hypothetical protein